MIYTHELKPSLSLHSSNGLKSNTWANKCETHVCRFTRTDELPRWVFGCIG